MTQSPELSKCPWCQGTSWVEGPAYGSPRWKVVCEDCFAQGPSFETKGDADAAEQKAVDAWQALPRIASVAHQAELVGALRRCATFIEALADNDPDEPIADNGMTVLGKLQFDAPAMAIYARAILAKVGGAP